MTASGRLTKTAPTSTTPVKYPCPRGTSFSADVAPLTTGHEKLLCFEGDSSALNPLLSCLPPILAPSLRAR